MNSDFTYDNPTKIYFGKNSLQKLDREVKNYGDTILLAYGKGSIKRNGIYDSVLEILKANNKKIVELPAIMANPTYVKVQEGCKLVREHNVDLILAIGGGSTIDCAKAISASAYCKEDAWDYYFVQGKPVVTKITPVASILTLAGTGSEMNGGSVITNDEKKLKNACNFSSRLNPRFSILNPEFTFSLPKYQMLSGIFDMFSHSMEEYFSNTDDVTTDYLLEGLMRSIIHSGRITAKDPKNYEARSNLMWSSSLAMNPLMGLGKKQDWQVHMIEHQLGAFTDCAHGMGLAAISLPYYRFMIQYGLDKFVRYAKVVWNVDPTGKTDEEVALEGIDELEKFMKEVGIVTNIRELNATEEMLPKIANSTIILGRGFKKVTPEDILDILKTAYKAK